jgi:ribosome-binding protein aMBF1 (putative translation factor)
VSVNPKGIKQINGKGQMNNHQLRVMAWQKENKEKYKAEQLARCHPQLTMILYECLHRDRKKENHHPDYKKWKKIFRVCAECHAQFHPRTRTRIKTEERRKRNGVISQQKKIARIWGAEEMAQRVRTVRLILDISQDRFANLLGLGITCHSIVSRWELGKAYPSRKYIERIESYSKRIEENGQANQDGTLESDSGFLCGMHGRPTFPNRRVHRP